MARDFGKVRTAFWQDERVANWSERCKFMALYLLTSPHTNAIGCFRAPAQYIAADTGLSVEDAVETLRALECDGFLLRDERTSFVFLRNYLEHNGIENGKVATHCIRLALDLPKSLPFRKDFEAALIAATEAYEGRDRVVWEGYRDPIETVSKPNRTPEPEPETEPEPESERASARPTHPQASPSKPEKTPIRDHWPLDRSVPEPWQRGAEAERRRLGLEPVNIAVVAAKFASHYGAVRNQPRTMSEWQSQFLKFSLGESAKTHGKQRASEGQSRGLAAAIFAE